MTTENKTPVFDAMVASALWRRERPEMDVLYPLGGPEVSDLRTVVEVHGFPPEGARLIVAAAWMHANNVYGNGGVV